MKAGRLTDWLVFQILLAHPVEPQDPYGAPNDLWPIAFETWGECQRLGSREFPADQKRQSQTTARFVIRYDDQILRTDLPGGVAANYRVLHAGKIWNISEPFPDRRHTFITIEASETL